MFEVHGPSAPALGVKISTAEAAYVSAATPSSVVSAAFSASNRRKTGALARREFARRAAGEVSELHRSK